MAAFFLMNGLRTQVAALALGSTLGLVGCSTERVELGPSSGAAAEPSAPPSSVVPEVLAPRADAPAVASYETGGTPAGSDTMLPSYGQLPNAFTPPPAPERQQRGCQKIDFLFVIDNSDSMEDEQANLVKSFPGFVAVLGQVLEAKDFHVMVVGTDGALEEEDEPTLDVSECDGVRGAGKRRSANGDDCGIQNGLAFMTHQQPELATTFSCAAAVGTRGSAFEEPMDAMLAATGAALNAPGRCNAGFLRDDAMLVVTFITDEEDRHSTGEPADWRRLLLAAKSNKPDAVMVLGLVGDNNVEGGLPGGPCRAIDADASPRLQAFVDSFARHGVLGSVCAPDYTQFFTLTLGWIDNACQEFARPIF
jgi:hypothetical protein